MLEARSELLVCAQDACSALLRKDCVAWLAEVSEALPAVSILVRGADGCDRPDARTFIDGVLVPRGAEGRPIEVDPGPHALRAEVDGLTVEQTVVAAAGERRRTVTLAAVNGASCGATAPPQKAIEVLPTPVVQREGPRPVPVIVYVLGGIGVVGLGVGSAFGIAGWSDKADLDRCRGSCSDHSVNLAQRTFAVSDVSIGVGLASLAVATILYLTR